MTGERVLLVEDETLIAMDTEEILIAAGYTVVGPALSLEAALELAENEAIDVAVLDIYLDGKMVWPVADRLLARAIPIVLLSGFGDGLELPPTLADAPRLTKPLKNGVLAESVAQALASRPS